MKILVTRLRFLGDIILCTPLLQRLREAWPDARIDFLGASPHVDVLFGHAAVDTIHVLGAKASNAEMFAMARQLRTVGYDVAIDLFGNPRSALLTFATGASMRIGGDRGARARLFTHRRGRPSGDRSAVRHHLDKLVPLLGEAPAPCPTRLSISEAEIAGLRRRLGLDASSRVQVVHPGSTWPDKAWPEDRWPAVVGHLTTKGQVFVLDPPGQSGLAAQVTRGTRARALDVLGVREVMALLTHADLYVGNDGGILHAAVALGVPTVGLLGPTEPDIWFPYEDLGPFRVLHRCGPEEFDAEGKAMSRLRGLSVDEVIMCIETVSTLPRTQTS